MVITESQLLFDLYVAFYDAAKHKKSKSYVKQFEKNLHANLIDIRNDLLNKCYVALPSTCFYISDPKPREIFAAMFRDRIVLHLYYNYTHKLFERTFINDTYSCIKGKGTHYGINRLDHYIKKASSNYLNQTYILKCDIKGYFMHINRNILYNTIIQSLQKMRFHKVHKREKETWDDIIDFDLIFYLTKEIALLDPTKNCNIIIDEYSMKILPKHRSLFNLDTCCGLPIGNLTSQLFSNIYLNKLDLYIKRVLKFKYYGRYVDDFYIVDNDKNLLKNAIIKIQKFLLDNLHLELQLGKTKVININKGIEFLGAFIKMNRRYIANKSLKRIKYKLQNLDGTKDIQCSINSFLGTLNHYKTFNIKYHLFFNNKKLLKYGYMNMSFNKYIVNK